MKHTEAHDRAAELMLCGSLFHAGPDMVRRMFAEIRAEDFFTETARKAWRVGAACQAASLEMRWSDGEVLVEATRQGAKSEVLEVRATTSTAAGYEYLRDQVKSYRDIRSVAASLRDANNRIAESLKGGSANAQSIAGTLASELHTLLTGTRSNSCVHQSSALRSLFDRLEDLARRRNRNELIRAETGIDALNEIFPLREDSIFTLVAPSGTGKTSLMAQVALFTAAAGGRVHVLTAEMPADKMMLRILAQAEPVHEGELWDGNVTDRDFESLYRYTNNFESLALFVDDCPPDLDRIEQAIRYGHAVNGCTWFVIDYAQLIHVPGAGSKSKNDQMELVGRRLLQVRRELGVAIMLLSQTTKHPKGPTWTVDDADNGRGLKQPSDAMGIMHEVSDDDTQAPEIAFDLGKRRHGSKDADQFPFVGGRIANGHTSLTEECDRRRAKLHRLMDSPAKGLTEEQQLTVRLRGANTEGVPVENLREAARLLGLDAEQGESWT